MKKILWLCSVVFVLITCKTASSGSVKENVLQSLENTQWQLADETGTKLPTLFVHTDKASGNATCNNYTAMLETNAEGAFSVKNIATTRMACKKDTEAHYLNLLKKATRYKATSKTLELYQNDLLLLKFNRIP